MRTPCEFPAVDSTPGIGDLDVVETLFECVSFVAFLLAFVDCLQAFWERVLVDVVLVVELRIWITCDSLMSLAASGR